MKKVKTVLNLIISFLLILCFLSGISINLLGKKVLEKEYLLKKIEENEFYLQISREVTSGFEDYIYQSGLPEETIKDLYTDEDIKNDIKSIVDYVYEGKEIKLSDEKIKSRLDEKINTFLKEENRTLNKKEKENVSKFENLIINSYKSNVKISNTLIEMMRNYFEKAQKIYNRVKNIPLIVGVCFAILLVIINAKNLFSILNYVSISIFSTGLVLKLLNFVIVKNIKIEDILILATSFTNLVKNLLKEIVQNLSDKGNIYIVIGLTGIIIYAMLNAFKENEKKD